jgi:hypothetical protein
MHFRSPSESRLPRRVLRRMTTSVEKEHNINNYFKKYEVIYQKSHAWQRCIRGAFAHGGSLQSCDEQKCQSIELLFTQHVLGLAQDIAVVQLVSFPHNFFVECTAVNEMMPWGAPLSRIWIVQVLNVAHPSHGTFYGWICNLEMNYFLWGYTCNAAVLYNIMPGEELQFTRGYDRISIVLPTPCVEV